MDASSELSVLCDLHFVYSIFIRNLYGFGDCSEIVVATLTPAQVSNRAEEKHLNHYIQRIFRRHRRCRRKRKENSRIES